MSGAKCHRRATPTGEVITFVGGQSTAKTNLPQLASGHPLLERDIAIAKRLHADPVDQGLTRIWFYNGKLTTKDPRRHSQDEESAEEVPA